MPESLDEFRKRRASAPTQGLEAQIRRLEQVTKAEVGADLLTGDSHWNMFLSHLQALRDAYAARVEAAREAILVSANTETDLKLKMEAAACNEALKAIDAIMELPKTLKENGETARAWLEKLKPPEQ